MTNTHKRDKKYDWATLRYDLPASVVVFLVALPLCLGIAMASNAPLYSGILTGVIGGIVVGALSGSSVSVSGPAAGLTVIVANGIASSGTFNVFLCAVMLSGLIQILFGVLRAGFLASLFPNSVVKGMLSAIGITIILKQIPHALGTFGSFESDMAFWDFVGTDASSTLLKGAFDSINFGAVLVCVASVLILAYWEKPKFKARFPRLTRVPGPLVAVTIASVLNRVFQFGFPGLALWAKDGHLVQLPPIDSFSAFASELAFPDLSAVSNVQVWILALTIAAIGSVETLLSIESTDKLDPLRRVSNSNRELFAQGVGNTLAGLAGGIPMTSVIVRSSANIYAGSRTRFSAIMHGVILLASVLVIGHILNLIPLAALAAVLLTVGYKLAHPKLVKAMYRGGSDQFVPFILTILAILFTDLLKGVAIGLLVGLAFVIKASYYSAIIVVEDGRNLLIRFTKDVTFIHKIRLKKVLTGIAPGTRVYFDASRAGFIDRDVFEMVNDYAQSAAERDIQIQMRDISIRAPRSLRKSGGEGHHGVLQEAVVGKSGMGQRKT